MDSPTQDLLLYHDAINMLCGKLIGEGATRQVFECTLLPGYVVKIERNPGSFHNVTELRIWEAVCETEYSKWFAQVHSMSGNGRILIMEKTTPPGALEWPDKLPVFMTDLHKGNFGMSQLEDPKTGKKSNRFVAHDYALHLMLENGMTKRLKTVKWQENT